MAIMKWVMVTCLLGLSSLAQAADDEVEHIYVDIRALGSDLLDEMVYTWLDKPPIPKGSGLILADVDAPMGLDSRFSTQMENRLYELLQQNPNIDVQLIHCAVCKRWVAKSTPQQTIIARGIDQPEVLENFQGAAAQRYAMHLSFEAAGRELTLRAQIYELSSVQRVIWARTYVSSLTARSVLQQDAPLVSLEQARRTQADILAGREEVEVTTRGVVRIFNLKGDVLDIAPIPFIEAAAESIARPSRNFRMALTLGFASLADSVKAWSFGAQVSRLLFRKTPSLATPDLYVTFGAQFIRMQGPAAATFGETQIDVSRILDRNKEPKASLVAYRLGLETHAKFRLGAMAFLENIPLLDDNPFIKEEELAFIPYHAFGFGVVYRW